MLTLLVFLTLAVHPDLDLIGQALKGRKAATRLLVRRLLPVIRARCRLFLNRRPSGQVGAKDIEDLTQETWLVLLENDGKVLRAYDPERGMSLEGYVGLITQRQLWRNHEAQQAQKRGEGAEARALDDALPLADGQDPEAELIGRNLLVGLNEHLEAELPTRGRLVLAALYQDHRDPDEVAGFLGVSQQVVYNWQHRIRTLARNFLAGTM